MYKCEKCNKRAEFNIPESFIYYCLIHYNEWLDKKYT